MCNEAQICAACKMPIVEARQGPGRPRKWHADCVPPNYVRRHTACKDCGDALGTKVGTRCNSCSATWEKIRHRFRPMRFHPPCGGDKTCRVCGETKNAECFGLETRYRDGRRSSCKACVTASSRELRLSDEYKTAARERARARTPEYRRIERQKAAAKLGQLCIPRDIRRNEPKAHVAAWLSHKKDDRRRRIERRNAEKKAHTADQRSQKKSTKPIEIILRDRIRYRIKKVRKRSVVMMPNGSHSLCGRFGYSAKELVRHIERQFTKGMTWDRLRLGEIHIDHIVPIVDFDLSDPVEVKRCFSLTNLRPMWARSNVLKGNQRETLL